MRQISDKVFAEDFLFELELATPLLPSPYAERPYLVIEDFLDASLCRAIIDTTQRDSDVVEAKLRSTQNTLDQKIRNTKIHRLSPHHQTLYDEALSNYRAEIEHFFTLSLTQSTQPQLLEYTKGSFYKAHADDSSVLMDRVGTVAGFKQVAPQRKLTTLLFLSEYSTEADTPYQFSGGELTFNYLKDTQGEAVTLRPKMGTLLVFGSNPIYTHEVKEVTAGYRLTLAQWHDAIL